MLNAMTSGPAVYSRADTYTMARYLRISQEDDARDESNSITNQREIIRDYIASRNEFGGARLVEYKDDGLTGALTDREDYQRLFRDVERGDVNCIIVKDLSRIGRDMLEVDDMLMNRLVTLGIRFIAIGDGYDSFLHPLSNLELAVINLANQQYIRDLAQKSLSVKLMKLKRGEHLSMPPFGYVKSKTEKNRLAIDDEAAGYVKLIFSLAAEGNNFTRTAYLLNAQGIPTPAAYKRERGMRGGWKQTNPGDEFWTSGSVGMILNSLTYTGTSTGYRSTTVIRGTKHTYSRPKDEWIIVPDAHPAIVSRAEYDRAHEAINQKRRADAPIDHIFWSKLKCPVCGRTMKRINPRNPAFKCYTRYYTDRYDCLNFTIPQTKLEAAVLSSVKALAAVLTDKEELRLAALTQIKETRADIENRIRSEENAVRVLEESITKHFTALVSGKLSKDAFLSKKEAVNTAVARKKAELEHLRERHYTVTAGKGTIEERLSELRPLLTLDKLNRELVDILIDKIFVRDENDIEIVWVDGWDGQTVGSG